jgi:hypothetical protein
LYALAFSALHYWLDADVPTSEAYRPEAMAARILAPHDDYSTGKPPLSRLGLLSVRICLYGRSMRKDPVKIRVALPAADPPDNATADSWTTESRSIRVDWPQGTPS